MYPIDIQDNARGVARVSLIDRGGGARSMQ